MQPPKNISEKKLINFFVGWIFVTSIITPLLIILLSDDIAYNVPVEKSQFIIFSILELASLISSYFIYVYITRAWPKDNLSDKIYKIKPDLMSRIIAHISSSIIFFYAIANIISPASYEDVNSIGSTAVFGGSIAIATIYPLLVAIVIGFTTLMLLARSPSSSFEIRFFVIVLAMTAVSGVLSGGRMAFGYPFLPYLLSFILRHGVMAFVNKYIYFLIASVPIVGLFLIYSASYRVGGSASDIEDIAGVLGLFLTHIYLKFSGITNSVFLYLTANAVDYGSSLTALSGSFVTFIPRFLFESKPISGSLDGFESGLPYRIAADILGYDYYGNVALSPATLSYWLAGSWGVLLNVFATAGVLILVRILIYKSIKLNSPIFIGIAFYLIGMPHFISFYVDFTQSISLIIRGLAMYIVFSILKTILFGSLNNFALRKRNGGFKYEVQQR